MTYGPPQPTGQYPPHWQAAPPPNAGPRNGVALAGFVVSLCSVFVAVIPLLGVASWIGAPVGIVLSTVGLSRANRLGGRGHAISGVILGAIGLLICVLWVTALASVGSSSSTTAQAPSSRYYIPSQEYTSYRPTVPSQAPASTAPAQTGVFTDGTWIVGQDIQPGRYRTDGASPDALFQFCSASRQRDDGTAIGFPETTNTGPAYITVRESDGMVEFVGDCTWTRQ